jgi:hypothetical protein
MTLSETLQFLFPEHHRILVGRALVCQLEIVTLLLKQAEFDIKSYFMGLSGRDWSRTTSSQLPVEYQPDEPQTHNALDDARAQASIFSKLMNNARDAKKKK